jgi:hypothetical protein
MLQQFGQILGPDFVQLFVKRHDLDFRLEFTS